MTDRPTTPILRRLRAGDLPDLIELRATHAREDQFDSTSSMERLPAASDLAPAAAAATGLVAQDDHGRLVAYGCWRTWREQDATQVYLIDGYVAPTARGAGIGTRLLRELEAQARQHAEQQGLGACAVFGANASSVQPDSVDLLLAHGYEHTFDQIEMRLQDGAVFGTDIGRTKHVTRHARIDDASALSELTQRVWAGREFFSPPTTSDFADWLGRSDLELFDVIEDEGGRVIAFIAAELSAHHAEIDDLQVDPAYQRRGIATALVAATVAKLHAREVREIRLNTEGHDPAGARTLYERLGFELHRTYHRYRKGM